MPPPATKIRLSNSYPLASFPMRRRATALISIPAAMLIAACQPPDDTTPPEPPQTVLACQGKFVTGPQTIAGFDLAIFMQRTRLPSDVRIAAGRSAVW